MKAAALAALATLWAGCASGGSIGSFRGVPFPVMLGPKDRLGADSGAEATKVDEWWAEAVNYAAQYDTEHYRVYQTQQTAASFMGVRAVQYMAQKHGRRPNAEMRVTSIEGTAYVTAFGGAAKEYVRVEAEIVQPEGAR